MFAKTLLALQQLRSDIVNGNFSGGELPSGRKLCTRYNIGRGAVKVILSELQKENLIYNISERKLGIVKRDPQRRKHKLLVVSHPFLTYGWAGNICFDRQNTVKAAAANYDFEVEFATKDFTNLDYGEFQQLQNQQYSGVLFLELYHQKTVQELLKNQIPALISGVEENNDIPCCRMDYRQIGRLAAYELIRHGHHRLGLITGSLEKFIFDEILRGFRGAMAEEGLEFDPELTAEISGQYGSVEDEVALHDLLDRAPTGVFALRQNRIMMLQSVCRQRSLTIPDDLSIIGFNTPDWPGIEAGKFTMITDEILQLDKIAVKNLAEWIITGQQPGNTILAPCILRSKSVKSPVLSG